MLTKKTAFYATQQFITAFVRGCSWFLSRAMGCTLCMEVLPGSNFIHGHANIYVTYMWQSQFWLLQVLRSEFRRPRDVLLTMVAEFLTKCTARLNDINKKSGQDSKSFELLDTKAHVVCTLDINYGVLTKGLGPSYLLQIYPLKFLVCQVFIKDMFFSDYIL